MTSIFNLPQYKPLKSRWDARKKELLTRAGYYDGTIYQRTRDNFWFLGGRVNGEIKPLFLPFARAVDTDCGLIGGGWDFSQDESKYQIWKDAQDVLFDVSKWDTNGVLFVHYGAVNGVTGLRVSDAGGKVIVSPADPTRFMLVYGGMLDNGNIYSDSPEMALWIEDRVGADGNKYEYAEVITPQTITTYRAGEPFGYGQNTSEYANTQGVIPIVESLHINDGTELGECTYQKAITLLNETNDMATRLSSIIKKHDEPQTIVTGADPSDLKRGSDVAWFLPADAKAEFAVSNIDIQGVLEFIREIKMGVHDALPELSFDELKKASQIATQTLELQLMELIIKVKRVRPNYDRALSDAMRLAGAAAERLGISEIAPLNDPALMLDPNRPILPVMPKDKIELELAEIELENARRGSQNQEGINGNA